MCVASRALAVFLGRGWPEPLLAVRLDAERRREDLAGVRFDVAGDFFGRAAGDDSAAPCAAVGADVDDPVGRLHDVEIVLDDEHRVAGVDELVQHFEQQLDVGEVEAGRRLVEQVHRAAGGFFHQLAGQLDALGFAAGERGRRLADLDVVEADRVERAELVMDRRDVLEVGQRFLHVHLEHLGDALFLVHHLQRFAIEAMAVADGARDPDVGQEIHFEAVRAVAFARFAAAALHVEAEPARLVAAALRFGQLRVEAADVVEQLDVRAGIRARRAADRRLVDDDQLVELVDAFDAIVVARLCLCRPSDCVRSDSARMSFTSELLPEPLAPVTQTNAPSGISTSMFLRLLWRAPMTFSDALALPFCIRRCSGTSILRLPLRNAPVTLRDSLGDLVGGADGDDFAAADAGAGAEVDQVVGGPHRVFVVFDDDDRVAQVAELGERVEQALVVARVEADRGFVEDVEHADEAAADLAGEADALRFAAGERGGGAFEREVFEADVVQEAEAAADFFEDLVGDLFFVAFEDERRRRTRRRRKWRARKLPAAFGAASRRSAGWPFAR